jgi:hypothetical protein
MYYIRFWHPITLDFGILIEIFILCFSIGKSASIIFLGKEVPSGSQVLYLPTLGHIVPSCLQETKKQNYQQHNT